MIEVQTLPRRTSPSTSTPFLAACESKTRLIFVCSPNNPTGTIVPRAGRSRLLDGCVGTPRLVVVDEAYIEFGDEPPRHRVTRTLRQPARTADAVQSAWFRRSALRRGSRTRRRHPHPERGAGALRARNACRRVCSERCPGQDRLANSRDVEAGDPSPNASAWWPFERYPSCTKSGRAPPISCWSDLPMRTRLRHWQRAQQCAAPPLRRQSRRTAFASSIGSRSENDQLLGALDTLGDNGHD